MYADFNTVASLCINVRSGLDLPFVEAHAKMVDAQIDSRLGEVFYWPKDGEGNTIAAPEIVKAIANYLTASQVEAVKFAVNEASGQVEGNPYAKGLERKALALLNSLTKGEMAVPELKEMRPIRHSAAPMGVIAQAAGVRRGKRWH